MINTVRLWTRKPARLFAAIESEEQPSKSSKSEPKEGFLTSFFKMWESQANLAIRSWND